MSARLVIVAGPDKGRTFPLSPGQTLQVGRSQSTPTQLTDPAVSRVHCEVEVEADRVVLHNLSTNGTTVNGRSVLEEHPLKSGDVIRLGGTEIHYLVGDAKPNLPPPGPEQTPDPESLLGQRLEEYVVDKVIAHGTTGVVFKATDLTSNQRPIALKVLSPEVMKDDEEMQRFVRAMKTMIPVRHAHLIAIHGAGKTGPFCWIAMEYFEGDNLHEVTKGVASGAFAWKDAYRVAVHMGRALEYAHEHAIVHRNVTPANILWRQRDRVSKLGDLMLAKALEGRMAQQVTRPGQLLGDAAYMAPERTHGTGTLDTRSDLYGLGATLYALLTGRPPVAGAALPELIQQIRTADPQPPRNTHPDIPEAFEKMVLKLLAKKPEDRYPSAKKLLADLDVLSQTTGVSAYF